ncbi:Oidioi.mRNA.OKI2018_I69.XSR.g16893.t1.cds [Oikopleura dioica]|uniref:Oidioi.mRNA.OKI2018_I69.XSR.g16893.t1.cds n=1 Tax=Oikopleura dioica TaxID=34765 RepID=A0ABN7SLD5_OIKDI|nr:Oidioi.mRNA.OKI2018_I69.XSR.g16893.t1.cds [Oikopleura dioica]
MSGVDMKLDDWNQRWVDKRTGWHKSEVNPTLEKYFPTDAKPDTFFPLCGKTLDMIWVAEKGCKVRGAEFSQLAIDQFFEENSIENKEENGFRQSTSKSLDIGLKQGDFFEFPEGEKFALIFDRGSMVAVNPSDREKYAEKIKKLLRSDGKVLLSAISRDEEHLKNGPPFHLTLEDVKNAYEKIGMKVNLLGTYEDRSSLERLGLITINEIEITF